MNIIASVTLPSHFQGKIAKVLKLDVPDLGLNVFYHSKDCEHISSDMTSFIATLQFFDII